MGGLSKVCKIHGSLKVIDKNGKETVWIYDYINDRARLKSEMTKEEIKASEKARDKKV